MLNRRGFLTGSAALVSSAAVAQPLSGFETASMRGGIDATEFGVHPGAIDDQSRVFEKMLAKAAATDTPVFLPAGTYVVSNLKLPARVRLSGVPAATRIVYGGDGHLFLAEDAELIEFSGLVIDGSNRWLGDHAQAIVDLRRVRDLTIDRCTILGAGKSAIALERVGGRIERTTISGALDYGIYSVEAKGLTIRDNTVTDCGNGGILVHRWQKAEDGTIVTGNRVERILARNGGTGQFGNGINLFRADNVLVSDNAVTDCAFSAIRANSASNARITGNSCLRSGETGLYVEFSFEGAIISANIVDGAANGISMVNFNEGGRMAVCSGNIVRNLSTRGPYEADAPGFGVGINAEAECALTGNVIENAPLYGLHLGWGPYLRNVIASGNVIRTARTGIAVSVVEGVGSAVISDNIIDGAQAGAIVGYRWVDAVTGDLAHDGAALYPGLTVERNRVS
ncbi:MAG: TIGR03808 family TAT-translocated repetitive protein [Rhizobiaceae bacterium]